MGRRPGFSEDELRKIVYSGHREPHTAAFVQHLAAGFPGDYGKLMLGMPLSAEGTAMLVGCRCAGLPSGYDLRFAGLRLVRRRQGVGWLVGGSPAGEEPEGVVGG
jgi:hypothetical protein